MQLITKDHVSIASIRSIVEGCIQNTPVIILGSGSSAAHGIYTMESLAEEIIKAVDLSDVAKTHSGNWNKFKVSMKDTKNLEKSLETIENSSELIREISATTWSLICKKDKEVFFNLLNSKIQLPLSNLIYKLSNGIGSTTSLKIITTNYDRLAEYSCDFINDDYSEYLHYTGFSYGLIRRPDDQFNTAISSINKRILNRSDAGYASKIRPIEILKVHGSIDWFETSEGQIFSVPFYDMKPENALPAIITPGKIKFERTHNRPYSTILERARQVLDTTNSYLVVGFGFRDNHIHNNLEKKIRAQKGNKSFVVLARTLTAETKNLFLASNSVDNFVLFESDGKNGTNIYKKDRNSDYIECQLEGHALWDLKEFNSFFLQGR